MAVVHVPGKKSGKIMLYALSTCGWCHKTKQLLDDLGVEYDYEYVDLVEGDEQDEVVQKVMEWNPRCNFPTLVLNNEKCIIGYKEDEIREELKK